MIEQPFVSVVLATYNRKEQLKDCLDSLIQQSYPKEKYEIIVVNDGSIDDTLIFLQQYSQKSSRLQYLNQKNQGPSVARNLGVKNARGEIVCFTDDDCTANEDWVKNLVSRFSDETVGGVGGKFVPYTQTTLVEKYGNRFNQEKTSKEFLLTGNAAYRKSIFDSIGGFDPYLRSLEDIDLGIRVKLQGYKLVYAESAIVTHRDYSNFLWLVKRQFVLGRTFAKLGKKYVHHFSFRYYLTKWGIFLLWNVLLLLTSIFRTKKTEFFIYTLFNSIILSSNIFGLLVGIITEKYPGRKIDCRIDFLEEESIVGLTKNIVKKLT